MIDVKDRTLEQLMGDIRHEAGRRAEGLLGRSPIARAPDRGGLAVAALLGILAGATVGAAVALLLAPRSGREMRERLSEWDPRRSDQLAHRMGRSSHAKNGESVPAYSAPERSL